MNTSTVTPKINTQIKTKTRLKVGLIGLGAKGADHLKALKLSKSVSLVGLSDNSPVALSGASELREANFFNDYRKMIESTRPEAVIISVPHSLHFPIADYALDNDLHVFIEKPLAVSLQEARYLSLKAKEKGLRVMVGTQRRFESSFALGKSLLPEIGRPFSFRYNYTISCDLNCLGWRGDKKIAGGGALIDMGYHALDILTWFCGLPNQVFLTGGKLADPEAASEVEDTTVLSFNYDTNLSGYIFLSRGISPEEEELKISGDKGALLVTRGSVKLFKKGLVEPVIEFKESKSKSEIYLEQLNHFYKGIIKGSEIISDIEYNIPNMALVEAAYKSQQIKKPVNPRLL